MGTDAGRGLGVAVAGAALGFEPAAGGGRGQGVPPGRDGVRRGRVGLDGGRGPVGRGIWLVGLEVREEKSLTLVAG